MMENDDRLRVRSKITGTPEQYLVAIHEDQQVKDFQKINFNKLYDLLSKAKSKQK